MKIARMWQMMIIFITYLWFEGLSGSKPNIKLELAEQCERKCEHKPNILREIDRLIVRQMEERGTDTTDERVTENISLGRFY